MASSTRYQGSVPSVLISREVAASGDLASMLVERLSDCQDLFGAVCSRQELYQDLTGNLGSPQPAASHASISAGFRTAMIHLVTGAWDIERQERYYTLGNNSYPAESAYEMADWRNRYWGGDIYSRLQSIKDAWDPDRVFWCRHCVGDESLQIGGLKDVA